MPLMMCCNSGDYAEPVFEEKRRILFLKTPKSFYETSKRFFKSRAFFQNQKRSLHDVPFRAFQAFLFQSGTAVFAIEGFKLMSVTVTARAAAFLLFFMFAYHGSRNDSGRYGNDGVTDEHDDGREETAGRCNGSDVPIAYCGHRDNGPVDAVGNVIELRVGHISFNHIHDRSHGGDKNEHEKKRWKSWEH